MENPPEFDTPGTTPWYLLPIKVLFVGVREFVSHEGLSRASALAYTSLLALIPLTVVILSIVGTIKDEKLKDGELVGSLFDRFLWPEEPQMRLVPRPLDEADKKGQEAQKEMFKGLEFLTVPADMVDSKRSEYPDLFEVQPEPSARGQVLAHITQFSENLRQDLGTIGIVGAIFLLVSSISLFNTIETTINRLWNLEGRRHPIRKLLMFWALLTLGPLLLGASIAMRALAPPELAQGLQHSLAPWILTWTAFFLLYRVVPDTRVSTAGAFGAAILAGSAWEVGKLGFGHYAGALFSRETYTTIAYGSLAIIPLFLLWLFLSWVIVLAGVKITEVWQHRRRYSAPGWNLAPFGTASEELLAIRLAVHLAQHQYTQGRGASIYRLVHDLGLPQHHVGRALERLRGAGLLVEEADRGRYLLSTPPDALPLSRVVEAVRGRPDAAFPSSTDPLERRVMSLFSDGLVKNLTLAQFLARGKGAEAMLQPSPAEP